MKNTMLYIFYKKELAHWSMMKELFREMEGVGGILVAYPIFVIIISICHYAFAVMHGLFELFLYFFNKEQFKTNLERMLNKVLVSN